VKIKTNSNLILFFIFFELILFLIFAFVSKYEPAIDRFMVLIFSYLVGMIYLFFCESKFEDFIKIFIYDLFFTAFTLRIGSLASSSYCLDRLLRLFYFLFLFSLTMNFIKQKDKEYEEENRMGRTNSVFIQSLFFVIFLIFALLTMDKLKLSIYTMIFFIIFFGFLLSYRKFILYIK